MARASNQPPSTKLRRRKRAMTWSLVIVLGAALVLPFSGLLTSTPITPEAQAANGEQEGNPRSDYWSAVREGVTGYTSVTGDEAGVLIDNSGQNWRALRNGPIANFGGWLSALALLALGAFYIFRGQVKLDQPRTGQTIERWTGAERLMHWYTATLFVLLAITGLSLLFGRALLIPLIGKDAFSAYAEVAMVAHNYLGPLFLIGVVLIILSWMKYNFFNRTDLEWFKKGGGIVGKDHPDAGRMNGGEKIWFWIVCVVGLLVSLSGLVLDFPNFGQDRGTMQLANVIHGIVSVIFVAVAFGHIYIGTLGTEGALEGMVSGRVDVAWAKQHHNLWYEEAIRDQSTAGGVETGRPPPGQPEHPSST